MSEETLNSSVVDTDAAANAQPSVQEIADSYLKQLVAVWPTKESEWRAVNGDPAFQKDLRARRTELVGKLLQPDGTGVLRYGSLTVSHCGTKITAQCPFGTSKFLSDIVGAIRKSPSGLLNLVNLPDTAAPVGTLTVPRAPLSIPKSPLGVTIGKAPEALPIAAMSSLPLAVEDTIADLLD